MFFRSATLPTWQNFSNTRLSKHTKMTENSETRYSFSTKILELVDVKCIWGKGETSLLVNGKLPFPLFLFGALHFSVWENFLTFSYLQACNNDIKKDHLKEISRDMNWEVTTKVIFEDEPFLFSWGPYKHQNKDIATSPLCQSFALTPVVI